MADIGMIIMDMDKCNFTQTTMWADLHSHILPGMDDGCKSCEESMAVLTESLRQGVRGIMATPHYYPSEPVEAFLARREHSYQMLQTQLEQCEIVTPRICLGAETAYRNGISQEPLLHKLCYGSSNYLLLELPFSKWSDHVLKEIQIIRKVKGIIPIIAHIERYMRFQDRKTLSALYEMDVYIQMNAEYLLDIRTRGRAKKLIRNEIIQIIASDCHNMGKRSPNLGSAIYQMNKSKMNRESDEIREISMEIFRQACQTDH